jgi:GMP synthase-like glutamine amidotransferase
MHIDQVATVPTVETAKGLLEKDTKVHVWGESEHTKIQGLYIQNKLFTTQAHLGFDEGIVKHEIEMRIESDAIQDEKVVDKAKETAEFEHDGEVVARSILRFFKGEDDSIL